MYKRIKAAVVGMVILFLLLGAGTALGREVRSIALALPGFVGDIGWNWLARTALLRLGDRGYEVSYTELVRPPESKEVLRGFAAAGYDLIIGHGFQFGAPAMAVAPEFPDTYFYVSARAPVGAIPPNLQFLSQLEFEGSFLIGMLAAMMTETGVVGHIGGKMIPPQIANSNAFRLGALVVNPDIRVLNIITGTFEDPAVGRETALTLLGLGVDVLYQTADSTGIGAMAAAKEAGIWIIGYASDQRAIAPDLMLTSNIVNIYRAFSLQLEWIRDGIFGGTLEEAGIEAGIIELAPFGPMVPEHVQKTLRIMRQAIIGDYLHPPEIYEPIW